MQTWLGKVSASSVARLARMFWNGLSYGCTPARSHHRASCVGGFCSVPVNRVKTAVAPLGAKSQRRFNALRTSSTSTSGNNGTMRMPPSGRCAVLEARRMKHPSLGVAKARPRGSGVYSGHRRSRKELRMTETELKLMAALAIMGCSRRPIQG